MNQQDQFEVLAHLRGEMTEEERRRFKGRLAVDPGLRATSEKSAKLLRVLEHWEPRGAAVDLADDVMAKVTREQEWQQVAAAPVAFPAARTQTTWWKRFVVPGAALAAAAATLVFWIGVSPKQLAPDKPVQTMPYRPGKTGTVMMDISISGAPESETSKRARAPARESLPESTLLLEVPSLDTAEQEVRNRIGRLGAGQVLVSKRDNAIVVNAVVPAGADLAGAFAGYGQLLGRNDAYRAADGRSVIVIRLRAR